MVLQLLHDVVWVFILAEAHLDLATALGRSRHDILFELRPHHVLRSRHLLQLGRVYALIDSGQVELNKSLIGLLGRYPRNFILSRS